MTAPRGSLPEHTNPGFAMESAIASMVQLLFLTHISVGASPSCYESGDQPSGERGDVEFPVLISGS